MPYVLGPENVNVIILVSYTGNGVLQITPKVRSNVIQNNRKYFGFAVYHFCIQLRKFFFCSYFLRWKVLHSNLALVVWLHFSASSDGGLSVRRGEGGTHPGRRKFLNTASSLGLANIE